MLNVTVNKLLSNSLLQKQDICVKMCPTTSLMALKWHRCCPLADSDKMTTVPPGLYNSSASLQQGSAATYPNIPLRRLC